VYAASAAATLTMTIAGSLLPALRAASIAPVVALRNG
jgi:ABC-type lipoprotein release transport system permease subunit